jgi:hypothetical protein
MKTYKQIEQRGKDEATKLINFLYLEAPAEVVDDFKKRILAIMDSHLKQALLDFYEEVVPERKLQTGTDGMSNYGFNDAIDQLNLNKQRYFEE